MLRHFSFSLIRQLVVSLVQLLTIAYIVQTHGVASYGIYAQILAVSAVCAICSSFGLGQAILYYENAIDDLEQKINIKMAIVELFLLNGILLGTLWISNGIFHEITHLKIYIIYVFNALVLTILQSVLQSRGDYKTVNYLLILYYIIPLIIFITSSLKNNISFYYILIISGFVQSLVCFLFSIYMFKLLTKIDSKNTARIRLFYSLWVSFKIGAYATLANGLNILNKKIIVIAAPYFLAGEVVGLLGILSALYEKALLPVTAFNFVSLRGMTQTSHCTASFSKNYGYKFRIVMLASFSVVVFVSMLMIICLPFISDFYFLEIVFISFLCLLNYMFRIQSRLLSNIFASFGKYHSNAKSTWIALLIFFMSLMMFNIWYSIDLRIFCGCICLSSLAMMIHRWRLVKMEINDIQYNELFVVKLADIYLMQKSILEKISTHLNKYSNNKR